MGESMASERIGAVLRHCVAGFLALWAGLAVARAHEVPDNARFQIFMRPAGSTLEVLIRAPLASMQDIDVPVFGPGYLAVSRADPALRDATQLWLTDNMDVYANEARLPAPRFVRARVSLASDRSFENFDRARTHFADPPLEDELNLYWSQQWMDVWLEYPIPSDKAEIALDLRFDRLGHRVSVILRHVGPDGAVKAFEFAGDEGLVRIDPRWHQAALSFIHSGFRHILDGIDHLLFLFCLVVPFRRLGPLIAIVTSFTVAHTITLMAAALGFVPSGLWFPPLVETAIAATIVFVGLENILGGTLSRRWMITFAFGLVHGFGFSFALSERLQFAGEHLVLSLLAFNLGVELGQIAVLLILVPALIVLFRLGVPERMGVIVMSALAVHEAWHWLVERGGDLLKFPFPRIDAAFLAGSARALMAALVLGALVWLVNLAWQRRLAAKGSAD